MKTENNTIRIGGHGDANLEEILSLKADISYTTLFFANGESKMVATTLKKLEERLKPYGFYRTHKNSVLNLKFISGFKRKKDKLFVRLANADQLLVSRRREAGLFELTK